MTTRRDFMTGALLGAMLGAPLVAPVAGLAQTFRAIPQRASARVIIDNDFAGDPDALVALAHQLLTPKTRTVLITASGLDQKLADKAVAGRSAALGRDIAIDLMKRAGLVSPPPVLAGPESFGAGDAQITDAARAIVAEAMREDKLPLFITCGGPLTNVAAALRLEPAIAKRMTLIWIGGGGYPKGGWEYNLATDPDAARHVIERSTLPLWQIPQNAYRQMQYSVAEMATALRPISPFSAWLYDRFTSPPDFIDVSGAWPLGDSPTVLLSALSPESSRFEDRPALRIGPDMSYGAPVEGRMVRVFETLDARLTFADFIALLRLHADGALPAPA